MADLSALVANVAELAPLLLKQLLAAWAQRCWPGCYRCCLRYRQTVRSAAESIARQPEAQVKITGNMILTAAFIEGVALFAVVVALLGTL